MEASNDKFGSQKNQGGNRSFPGDSLFNQCTSFSMCCEQKVTDDFALKELPSPNHISKSNSSRMRIRNGGRSVGG